MTNPEITKANTVESFMKANSSLRIGKDAVTDFLTRLNTLSAAVVKAAETSAINQNRKTIRYWQRRSAARQSSDVSHFVS